MCDRAIHKRRGEERIREEHVREEDVNNVLASSDRTAFDVAADDWQEMDNQRLKDGMVAALRDWGTALDLCLYEDLAQHLCGQSANNETGIHVQLGTRCLGVQAMRLIAPRVALRITALPTKEHAQCTTHLRKLLEHTTLDAIQWINVTNPLVQFITVRKGK
jgi:hypothetical protein